MQIKAIELSGFKSFGKKTTIKLDSPITSIVGPNGSGKSNVAEAIRFVLGEQSMKSMRGKSGSDLIFKGSTTLAPLGRASVTAIFDNTGKKIQHGEEGIFKFLSYDEIRISREIYADGTNEYIINDTKVRLKDIQEFLSIVNIGTTGHHIISQGEADRVLNASIKERKEMIEDALGLKLYQWRIRESEKKFEKIETHIKEGEISRREIAPHLQYLKKQVERIEKRKEQMDELSKLYNVYLAREAKHITEEAGELAGLGKSTDLENTERELREESLRIDKKIKDFYDAADNTEELRQERSKKNQKSEFKDNAIRNQARIEAEISILERNLAIQKRLQEERNRREVRVSVNQLYASETSKSLGDYIDQAIWRYQKNEFGEIGNFLGLINRTQSDFFKKLFEHTEKKEETNISDILLFEKEIHELMIRKSEADLVAEEATHDEKLAIARVEEIENSISSKKDNLYAEERRLFELSQKISEIRQSVAQVRGREIALADRQKRFEEEQREGAALIGSAILEYTREFGRETEQVDKSQAELYRAIERLKIKLEETGLSNVSDILHEHTETLERDQFLEKELNDLLNSKSDIVKLIEELSLKLETEFSLGIEKINSHFSVFFTDMFGGGEAALSVVQKAKRTRKKDDSNLSEDEMPEEEEMENGIEVSVKLPHKKVRDLSMLSGGERALTSIALLFAITQVNPPPFMVLDETDAALDEANARRYGSSLRSLAKHSKLVVITHNRETMNQADALYGVTVSREGASKILSVKFDEAVEYAK